MCFNIYLFKKEIYVLKLQKYLVFNIGYTPSYGNGTPVIEKKGSEEASVTTYTENNYQNTKTYENNSNLIQKDYTYNGYSNQPIGRQIS